MENNNHNILSRLLKSLYAMDPLASRILMQNQLLMQNQRMASAQQQANRLPYLTPSVPVGTIGSQSYPLGLSQDMPPLPNVSSALKSRAIQPKASSPSMPMATFGSMASPLGLSKDVEALPNVLSNLTSLQPQQALLPEAPIPTVEAEPTQSVPLVQPQKDTASQQSFWDQFRNPEFLQRLSDYAIGYASSDGTMAQSLANAAMNLRHGDLEREQKKQVNQTVEYLKSKGYSEEEAAVMARNPQMLSALLTGGDAPKLSQGFQWYDNPETGEREMRPIKGSPQELEYSQKIQAQKEWEEKKKLNISVTKRQLNIGMNAIHDAINLIKQGYATGFTGWFSRGFGGTPAYKLEQLFNTIKGGALKAVFESLKSMSNNGNVGVGPISDKESQMMVATFGALDAGRDPEGLLKTLGLLEETFKTLQKLDDTQLHNLATGQPIETPIGIASEYSINNPMSQGNVANLPIVKNAKEIEALPQGTEFYIRDANNTIMRIQK